MGVLISTGPIIHLPFIEFRGPVGLFNGLVLKTTIFRHLFRAHIITILASFILISRSLVYLYDGHRKRIMWVLAVFAVFYCIENIPFNSRTFDSSEYVNSVKDPLQMLNQLSSPSNLYFLPSCNLISGEHELINEINPVNREYIYASWKNQIDHNMYNGRLGHLTTIGYANSQLLCNMDENNFGELLKINEIDYLVVCKAFIDESFQSDFYPLIRARSQLVDSNDMFEIYDPYFE